MRERIIMVTSAHPAASDAARRIDWKQVTTVAVVSGRFFGRREVKVFPFIVTYGGYAMKYHLTKQGVVLEGRPTLFCSPVDLNGLPASTRMTLTKRLHELPSP
ncbi:MAG: hypothetical protein ABIQ64_00125 [Candidatus Saccharimonadales bacterium]